MSTSVAYPLPTLASETVHRIRADSEQLKLRGQARKAVSRFKGVSWAERHGQASLSFGFPFRSSVYRHPVHNMIAETISPAKCVLSLLPVCQQMLEQLNGRRWAGHHHWQLLGVSCMHHNPHQLFAPWEINNSNTGDENYRAPTYLVYTGWEILC